MCAVWKWGSRFVGYPIGRIADNHRSEGCRVTAGGETDYSSMVVAMPAKPPAKAPRRTPGSIAVAKDPSQSRSVMSHTLTVRPMIAAGRPITMPLMIAAPMIAAGVFSESAMGQ